MFDHGLRQSQFSHVRAPSEGTIFQPDTNATMHFCNQLHRTDITLAECRLKPTAIIVAVVVAVARVLNHKPARQASIIVALPQAPVRHLGAREGGAD